MADVSERDQKMTKRHWACAACGFWPRNRGDWCDRGCGSDYNQMIELSDLHVKFLAQARAEGREEALREVLADVREIARDHRWGALGVGRLMRRIESRLGGGT